MVSDEPRDIKLSEEQIDTLQASLASVGQVAIILNTFWGDLDVAIPLGTREQLLSMLMHKVEVVFVE